MSGGLWVGVLLVLGGHAGADPALAREALTALGPMHVAPLRFAATAGRVETWLGIIGTAEASHGAFIARLENGKPRTLPLPMWPAGVRVLAMKQVEPERAYLIVQPRSSREPVLLSVMVGYSEAPMIDQPSRVHVDLAGVHDLGELDHRLAAAQRSAGPSSPPMETVKSAMRTPAGAVKAISRAGIDIYRIHQATWLERAEHLAASAVPAPLLARIRAVSNGDDLVCDAGTCTPSDEMHPGGVGPHVLWTQEDGRWVVRTFIDLPAAKPPVPAKPVPPRAVAERGDGKRTLAALREQRGLVDAKLLAEAPLDGNGGIIGVAQAGGVPHIVATTEGIDQAYSMEEDPWAHPTKAPVLDVRFGDIDGDGRTDVTLWTDAGDAKPFAAVLFVPSSLDDAEVRRDAGSELALFGAKDAADALTRALASPRSGPTTREVCALFGGLKGRAAWKRATTANARVLRFSGYLPHTWQPEATPSGSAIKNEDLEGFGTRCGRLRCLSDGPMCAHGTEDRTNDAGKKLEQWSVGWYWFKREAGKWKVAGYASIMNGISDALSPSGADAGRARR